MTDEVVAVSSTPEPPEAPKPPPNKTMDDRVKEADAKKLRTPLIPFGWLPGHWGLNGKTRERAKIEYTYQYEDETCERKLAEFDLKDGELTAALAKIDYHYNHIGLWEYKRREADALLTGKKLELAHLEIDALDNEVGLTDAEYDKRLATIEDEAWVNIVKLTPDSDTPNHGEMELDWNDKFVEDLREAGYEGTSDEAVVDLWLADLCRNIAMEQFGGVGDFDEQVGDGFINRNKPNDGTREYE